MANFFFIDQTMRIYRFLSLLLVALVLPALAADFSPQQAELARVLET